MLDLLSVKWIIAPEEACAKCARLQSEGIVDWVGSDDNNSFLFGATRVIRSLFIHPFTYTFSTLEKLGITRKRLIHLAMMINGDSHDIQKSLLTVGPVRGLEILSYFPDELSGLDDFKNWWISTVKNKEPSDCLLFQREWIRKLVIPKEFPPEILLKAFLSPQISSEKFQIEPLQIQFDQLVEFMQKSSTERKEKITLFVEAFQKRLQKFKKETKTWSENDATIPPSISEFFARLQNYDKEHQKRHCLRIF
jgi:5'-3' exonuclease